MIRVEIIDPNKLNDKEMNLLLFVQREQFVQRENDDFKQKDNR